MCQQDVNGFVADVDECKARWDSCDKTTTRCVNNDGSFACTCLPGYTKDDNMSTSCFGTTSADN